MFVQLLPNLIGIRQAIVWHYLLLDGDDVVALDTGMGLSAWRIKRWFLRTGRQPSQLKAILLTHGHIDHTGCAASLQRWSGAPIYLHPQDVDIAHGTFAYTGATRLVGWMEMLGRAATLSRRPRIDRELKEGDELPYWGGLRVIHLPGHTPGHVGFYSAAHRILFAGDSILSRGRKAFFPFRLLNVDHALMHRSILKVVPLAVDWVYPMHHWRLQHNLMEDIRRYALRCAAIEVHAGLLAAERRQSSE